MNTEPQIPSSKWIRLKRKGYPTIVRENKPGTRFSTRIRFRGKTHYFTLAESADKSFSAALMARREMHEGRWAELKNTMSLRTDCPTTLGQVETAYRTYRPAPPKVLADQTKESNINALRNMLGTAGIEAKNELPLTVLTGELVYSWKQKILGACESADPETAMRLCRSANSILIQARSIFCDEARTYFERGARLMLPATLARFREEPGFRQVSKTDYHAPTDLVIGKTFEHIMKLKPAVNPESRNEFIACWLALGFGLRAGEMSRAKKEDFHKVEGDIAFRPPWFGKNKKNTPEVRVQLDAWQHLGPIVEALPADAFLLSGYATERRWDVFRRISGWMKALGWETTHHIHELRAWAGSYIADHAPGDGIRAAQIFLRHRSYATTEKYYGHHRKQQIAKVALRLPETNFTPAVLPADTVHIPFPAR